LRDGSKAPQAAGVIHTDFERGFICAEVMKFEDLERLGSEKNVKMKGFIDSRARNTLFLMEILSISNSMSPHKKKSDNLLF